ncbi:MAG TPA: hypothetical protein GX742_00895, partial [Acholeplasmataceae bacterium]|nr:hypothetical protein [Acholeplasmataceae bacterium]
IKSEILNDYIKISFINTTGDNLINTNVKTSKLDNINHGFGKSIINDILLEYNGFSNVFITNELGINYYNFELFLPLE